MKSAHRAVTKAIIPVAGLGTRFLPATKAQPKEMLPIVDKPVIQLIVEEAVASGIRDIIFVTSIGKRALEDHFDRNFELEYRLEQKKKIEELREVASIGRLARFAFVRQNKPLGDGHAILSAVPFIDDDEPIAILFGDDVVDHKTPVLKQLIDVYDKHGNPVIALLEVPKRETSLYGVIGGKNVGKRLYEIHSFVEKPKPANAPSNLAVVGKYILTPEALQLLKKQKPGRDGEIRLADAFITALHKKQTLHGFVFEGTRFDCGNKLEYVKAQIHFGLQRPEFKKDLLSYIQSL
ncbi:UTP--glucose-1-phosphate uridylyltransferase GalU [Candidatus Uhrbacteria bacterium]|nr:UTP--glucose-1-phosphate uridylyltransferase GalU [Candidatus Uhrbacteria bacterium]